MTIKMTRASTPSSDTLGIERRGCMCVCDYLRAMESSFVFT